MEAKKPDMVMVRRDDAELITIDEVEGTRLTQPATVRVLAETATMLMLEVDMPAGGASTSHQHDHESTGYVVRGSVRAQVGEAEGILTAGDGFFHPIGVIHSMTALEEGAVWLEIKSPPQRTWGQAR